MKTAPTKPHRDAHIRRPELAKILTDLGYPTAPQTLAGMASRGNGPKFSKWGRLVVYRWGDVADWIELRSTARFSNTSEHRVARSA